MKFCISVLALTIFVVAIEAQQYTTKYDNVDLEQILRNDRLLRNYVNCLLDKGKCSPDGQELKSEYEAYNFLLFTQKVTFFCLNINF